MSYCDDQYTKVPKPAAPSYTEVEKPAAPSYTEVEKPAAPSYTEVAKPAAPSYTITEKTTTDPSITPRPCLEPLALLTEDEIEILNEDSRVMTVEGAL